MLLGLAMMWQHQTQQAIAWFKQVVYQEPGYWPAHYYLAEMYRQSELYQPAQRTYRVVMQLLNDEINNPSSVCRLRLPMVFLAIRFVSCVNINWRNSPTKVANKSDYGYRSEKIRSALY